MQVRTDHTMVIASGGTTSTSLELEAYAFAGIVVPPLTSSTLQINGSVDGTNFFPIKDSTGTQQLVWASGTGGFCISSRDLEHCRGYTYIQFVAGSAQGATRTFQVCQKLPYPR